MICIFEYIPNINDIRWTGDYIARDEVIERAAIDYSNEHMNTDFIIAYTNEHRQVTQALFKIRNGIITKGITDNG